MIKKIWKPLGFLLIFIILCAIIARLITRGETLTDYAQANPETAYATPDKTSAPSPSPNLSLSPSPQKVPPSSAPVPDELSDSYTEDLFNPDDPDTVFYQEGFYYQPLSQKVIRRITGISYPIQESAAQKLTVPAVNIADDGETLPISYEDLRYVKVLYYDFHGEVQTGELICNKALAQDLVEIFYELFLNEYQIEKIRLIDDYNGDDEASMQDNNTSCFNYRVVDGTTTLSKHALGCAIDMNPFYNPYVVFSKDGSSPPSISPKGSESYADRSLDFPYKIDENDLCYKLFTEHGFTWGGNWNSSKDYQHFQKLVG